jgi:phosphoserine phosphatase RsbU/P
MINPEPAPNIMVVDDTPSACNLLENILRKRGCQVCSYPGGHTALAAAAARPPDLILLDVAMPEMNGYEVCTRLKADEKMRDIPVIFISSLNETTDKVKAFSCGGVDYVTKPFQHKEVYARVQTHLELQRQRRELQKNHAQLSHKHQQMQTDLDLAREIQMGLLPRQFPTFPRGVAQQESALTFCGRYQPAASLGGDFYQVMALSNSTAGVLVCDVMGHGVRAALVTGMIRGLMEELCNPVANLASDPARMMAHINRSLFDILNQTNTNLFVTAIYLVADVAQGHIRYANAGHPCPLLVRRNRAVVEPMGDEETGGPVLGMFEDAAFPSGQRPMTDGDLVLLFTDGVFEVESPEGQIYGEERLMEAVRDRMRLPADKLLDDIVAGIEQFSRQRGFVDDVCLVGMEVARVG